MESWAGDVVEESSKSLFLVVAEAPNNQGNTNAVRKSGNVVAEIVQTALIDAAGVSDTVQALHLGGSDVFEQPGRKITVGNDVEIFAHGGGEVAQAALSAGENVDTFLGARAEEMLVASGSDRKVDRLGFGGNFGSFFSNVVWSGFDDNFGDFRKFFTAGALINLYPILAEPEIDFFVTVLLGGRHLQKVDFDFFAVVEVADDGVSHLGDGARANVAADTIFVFVHEEKDVGAVEILIKTRIDIGDF